MIDRLAGEAYRFVDNLLSLGGDMLRKLGVSVAILVAIGVVLALVSPYFVGRRAESEFKNQLALYDARQPGVRLQLESYQRGFYSSEATLALVPGIGMPPESVRVWAFLLGSGPTAPEIHLHVYHGPIPFAAFTSHPVNLTPVLGAVEFRGADLPSGAFLGALKLDVYAVRYFNGRSFASFSVPPGTFNLGMLSTHWQGGSAGLAINSGNEHFVYNGAFGPTQLSFENPRSATVYNATLQDMMFSGDRTRITNALWIGHSQGSWGGFDIRANGMLIAQVGTWQWTGQSNVSADHKWLETSLDSQQHGGSIRSWHWSELTTHSAFQNLDVNGFDQFIQQARHMQPAPNVEAQRDALAQLWSALAVVVKPQTHGDFRIAVTAPDGRFTAHAGLQFDAAVADAAGVYTDATLSKAVDCEADIGFSSKLVNGFATQVMGQDAAQKIMQTLQDWLSQGLLQASAGGGYHAHIVWRAGQLKVNGQTPNLGGKQI